MNKTLLIIITLATGFGLGYLTCHFCCNKETSETATAEEKISDTKPKEKEETKKEENDLPPESSLKPGAFSVSLNVKDLDASKKFYETLGFTTSMDGSAGYYIMKNGSTLIGIFKGMFEGNMLTFNPGWDENAQPMEKYNDVRELHKILTGAGYKTEAGSKVDGTGPGYFMIKDPDGNMLLFDQHR